MLWTITKRNTMKFIASFVKDDDKKPLGVTMTTVEGQLREYWNRKHLERLHRIMSTLKRKGFIYLDEPEDKSKPAKYFPTPEGIAWLNSL